VSRFKRFRTRLTTAAIVCTRALITPVAFGVSAVIRDGAGRVLLVRSRYHGGWGLPGGGVDRAEAPAAAALREAREEVGLIRCGTPELVGIYTRRILWATNVIALYRLPEAEIAFKPGFEIRDILWADPAAPPPDTQAGTRRRLAELIGQAPQSPYW
jgi:8-oxo-dGTP pyrophosphatase MutT (NUDIX family)